jgi:cytochrome c556
MNDIVRFVLKLALLCGAVLPMTIAAQDAQLVIESRQANYREMGGAYKGIRDELKKKRPLMIMIRQHADQLETLTHSQLHSDWFPIGTGREAGIETEALDKIWQKRSAFDALILELNDSAKQLVEVVSSKEIKAIAKQHRKLGKTCKQCHNTYREEQD